jgi:hypothetical protein
VVKENTVAHISVYRKVYGRAEGSGDGGGVGNGSSVGQQHHVAYI